MAAVVLTVASCADDDDSTSTAAVTASDIASCDEVYADGAVFDTAEDLEVALCDRGDGREHLFISATTACSDGRTLYWNDKGWGYLGEPFHRYAPGAERVAPETERQTCTP